MSPGPGLPVEHQNLKTIIKQFASSKSILGVCLGHQAIAECFGAKLQNLDEVMHGVSTKVNLSNDDAIYKNLPDEIKVVKPELPAAEVPEEETKEEEGTEEVKEEPEEKEEKKTEKKAKKDSKDKKEEGEKK